MITIEDFDWDEFQQIKFDAYEQKYPNFLTEIDCHDFSLSNEIYKRDVENIIFLLKNFNEDILLDDLITVENVKRIYETFIKVTLDENDNMEKLKTPKRTAKCIPFNYYFLYKKDNVIRKIVIPDLDIYVNFIIRTLQLYDVFFLEINQKLSQIQRFTHLVPLVNETSFTDSEYQHLEKLFTNFVLAPEIKQKQLEYIINYEYCLYVDLENFYNNIYIHEIERLKDSEFYGSFEKNEQIYKYFKFLHDYNMAVNKCETRGIITGPFSSYLSAELLLMEIDYQINKEIEKNGLDIHYTRYADDYKFYSDSIRELEDFENLLQRILIEYNLKINSKKRKYDISLNTLISFEDAIVEIKIDVDDEKVSESMGRVLSKLNIIIEEDKIQIFKNTFKYMISQLPDEIFSNSDFVYKLLVKFLISKSIKSPNLTRDLFRLIANVNNKPCFSGCFLEENYIEKKKEIINSKYKSSLLENLFLFYFTECDNLITPKHLNFKYKKNSNKIINDNKYYTKTWALNKYQYKNGLHNHHSKDWDLIYKIQQNQKD